MNNIKDFFELKAFGVCEWLGEKLGMKSSVIRVYFIYLSFIAMGSPIVVYLFIAFWLEQKRFFQKGHKGIWDL